MTKSQAYKMLTDDVDAEELGHFLNNIIANHLDIDIMEIPSFDFESVRESLFNFVADKLTDEPEEELDDNSATDNPPTLST